MTSPARTARHVCSGRFSAMQAPFRFFCMDYCGSINGTNRVQCAADALLLARHACAMPAMSAAQSWQRARASAKTAHRAALMRQAIRIRQTERCRLCSGVPRTTRLHRRYPARAIKIPAGGGDSAARLGWGGYSERGAAGLASIDISIDSASGRLRDVRNVASAR